MRLEHIFYLLLFLFPQPYLYTQTRTPSICVVIRESYLGEHAFAKRIQKACENLNWRMHLHLMDSKSIKYKNYDWVLTLVPGVQPIFRNNSYLAIFDPEKIYFKADGHLKKSYLKYAGFLTTYTDTSMILEDLENETDRLYPKRWYPTVQYYPYREVVPDRLFYLLGHWGVRVYDSRYKKLQELLATKSYTNFFGSPIVGKSYPKSYRGVISFDGERLINTISQMGVCLVLHSKTHLKYSIPSGRIFEAVAASAVTISDLNEFVIEHFGDSVLYIDQTLSGEEMFKQVEAHMEWIRENPQEALEMAKKAHQIFEEHFLLENQLLDFDHFHRFNSKNKERIISFTSP